MTAIAIWALAVSILLLVAWLVFSLIRSEGRLRNVDSARASADSLFDLLDDVLIVTNLLGSISKCNIAATRLIGLPAEALLGRSVNDFVTTAAGASAEGVEAFWHNTAESVDGSIRNTSNERIPVLISRQVVRRPDGEIDGYVYVSTSLAKMFETQKRLDPFSLVDAVTKLPNLVMARNRLAHLMANSATDGSHVDFFAIQMRRVDSVNAVYGMATGDSVLRIIGERLAEIFSKQFVCHLGGGQFVGLAVSDGDKYGFSLALMVCDAAANTVYANGRDFDLGVSVGLSSYPKDGDNFDVLLEHAREASVSSDDCDENKFSRKNVAPDNTRWRHSRIELELASACRSSQFRLVYQPQVDLRDSHVVGLEALIRWDHPRWGALEPDEFIGIAEQSNQITMIDDWVIREVCRQRRELLDEGIWDIPIAVNIATTDLNHSDFEAKLGSALGKYGLTPGFLELELTEKSLSLLDDEATPLLERLRRFGVHIALDDFGTGYCNLTNLKHLPINRIKIDREFVRSLPDNESDALVCRTVIELAKTRQLDVVAEGVETAAQAQFLRHIGCDYAQGYLWSPPLDIALLSPNQSSSGKRMVDMPDLQDATVDFAATGIWRAT